MTKQIKFALAVVAFCTTAAVARRVGQFEMKGQAERQIAVLRQQIEHEREECKATLHTTKTMSDDISDVDKLEGYWEGFDHGVREYRTCKLGDRDTCNHIMMMVTAGSNAQRDVLYDKQGNYKSNAFALFEQLLGK